MFVWKLTNFGHVTWLVKFFWNSNWRWRHTIMAAGCLIHFQLAPSLHLFLLFPGIFVTQRAHLLKLTRSTLTLYLALNFPTVPCHIMGSVVNVCHVDCTWCILRLLATKERGAGRSYLVTFGHCRNGQEIYYYDILGVYYFVTWKYFFKNRFYELSNKRMYGLQLL